MRLVTLTALMFLAAYASSSTAPEWLTWVLVGAALALAWLVARDCAEEVTSCDTER